MASTIGTEGVASTPREREVIAFAREGESTRAIARRLQMPVRAVDQIVRTATKRLRRSS
jgi:DNA-binding NarL/FixJ family response regulator